MSDSPIDVIRNSFYDIIISNYERVMNKLGLSATWITLMTGVITLLKGVLWSVYRLPQDIQAFEDTQLIIIERYLNDAKQFAAPEEEIYETNIIRTKSCFQESIEKFKRLERRRSRLYDEVANRPSYTYNEIKKLLQEAVTQLKERYDIACAVSRMKRHLQKENLHNHRIKRRPDLDPRRTFEYENEAQHVGLKDPMEKLIKLLDLERQTHENRHLVAVAGQAGVGKTTLVRKVYRQIKGRFQMCAWVTVSQSYEAADILRHILQQFKRLKEEEIPQEWKNNTADLKEILKSYVSKNPKMWYIVVFDDVWDSNLTDIINYALVSGKAGRILMTTRKKESTANGWVYDLCGDVLDHDPLTEENAFDLLCKKLSFKKDYNEQQREKVLREILLGIPHRLPLIILAVGKLLSRKSKLKDWRTVSHNLSRDICSNNATEYTKTILLYSFQDLPEDIRSCFLYFGMFPEDHDINVGQLLRIWIADGLIKSRTDFTLEEVAKEYMEELLDRGLVMITSAEDSQTGAYFYIAGSHLWKSSVKVHDIYHQIIRDQIVKDQFSHVISDKDSSRITIDGKSDRLSIYCIRGTLRLDFNPTSRSHSFRSIILNHSKTFPELPNTTTNCVRVLHLEDSEIVNEVPNQVGRLESLRLLRLTVCRIESVPEFIGDLVTLQTLEINNVPDYGKVTLPQDIKRLSQLRHLIIHESVCVPLMVLESLTQLHTLKCIDVSESGLVIELQNLCRLRILYVTNLKVADVTDFCQVLMKMPDLHSLEVWFAEDDDSTPIDLEMQGQTHKPLAKLEELYISANLGNKLPEWIGNLRRLVSFTFYYYHGMKDPLRELQFLPCLEKLQITTVGVEELDFGAANRFEALRVLVIWITDKLHIKGNLPSLQSLHLNMGKTCDVEVPEHIHEKTSYYFSDDEQK